MSEELDLSEVRAFLRRFAADRDWERYHTPKNLAMAIAGEAGELAAVFQWMTPEQSMAVMHDDALAADVKDEIADVLQYLIRLSDVLDISLQEAVWSKLHRNESRFPTATGEQS